MSYEYTEELLLKEPEDRILNVVHRLSLKALAVVLDGQQTWAPAAMTARVPAWAYVFAREYREQWGTLPKVFDTKEWDTFLVALNRYIKWNLAHGFVSRALEAVRACAFAAYIKPEGVSAELAWDIGAGATLAGIARTLDLYHPTRWTLEED